MAYALLDGRMSYPAFVYLDENFARIMVSPGYKTPPVLSKELAYTSTEAYKKLNIENFKQ